MPEPGGGTYVSSRSCRATGRGPQSREMRGMAMEEGEAEAGGAAEEGMLQVGLPNDAQVEEHDDHNAPSADESR